MQEESVFESVPLPPEKKWKKVLAIVYIILTSLTIAVIFVQILYSELKRVDMMKAMTMHEVASWILKEKLIFPVIIILLSVSGLLIRRSYGWVASAMCFEMIVLGVSMELLKAWNRYSIILRNNPKPLFILSAVITLSCLSIWLLNSRFLKPFYKKLPVDKLAIENAVSVLVAATLSVWLVFGK